MGGQPTHPRLQVCVRSVCCHQTQGASHLHSSSRSLMTPLLQLTGSAGFFLRGEAMSLCVCPEPLA